MDAHGARLLLRRIAERQWSLAPAVAGGREAAADPDAEFVAEVGDGYRLYRFPGDGGGSPRYLRKTLVDGTWRVDDAGEPA